MQSWGELSQDHIAKDLGAVIVVLVGVLDEAESIDIADERLAVGSVAKTRVTLSKLRTGRFWISINVLLCARLDRDQTSN